ncbi:sugar ABC transporter permease [Streptomyces sp. CB01881]|uniref:carbohydrate ABC transporter permease n=1 Tax=Streptomyces sp. CB01881 TaxID=2078691 RepID=UPI000CDBAFC1|nr:sugar ABC transporter permease [Streptomyces sp. CB01881]AUY47734.1 lactose ABC transporter permease [Streptomyces sp. CB01881]TYC76210.1 sugar ABC transporter permease [Streptomyces sp. CB01881]
MTTATRTAAPAGPAAPRARRRSEPRPRSRWRRRAVPYLLLAPALITFAVFKAYPIVSSLLLSLTTGAGAATRNAGTANYRRLLHDPLFWTALRNTAQILVVQVPLMLVLALGLAVGMNSVFVRWRTAWRLGVFMPAVTGLVATGVVFAFLLNTRQGAVNHLLEQVGLPGVDWLGSPFWSRMAVVLVLTWHYTGYNAVIYLAGLQGIPRELYEAAMVDGAGPLRRFASVTLPALRPVLLFTVVLSTIGTLQLFDEPYVLTRGGPDNATLTVSMYLYDNGFHYFDFGYASAIAYALTLLVSVLGAAQMRLMGERP